MINWNSRVNWRIGADIGSKYREFVRHDVGVLFYKLHEFLSVWLHFGILCILVIVESVIELSLEEDKQVVSDVLLTQVRGKTKKRNSYQYIDFAECQDRRQGYRVEEASQAYWANEVGDVGRHYERNRRSLVSIDIFMQIFWRYLAGTINLRQH